MQHSPCREGCDLGLPHQPPPDTVVILIDVQFSSRLSPRTPGRIDNKRESGQDSWCLLRMARRLMPIGSESFDSPNFSQPRSYPQLSALCIAGCISIKHSAISSPIKIPSSESP